MGRRRVRRPTATRVRQRGHARRRGRHRRRASTASRAGRVGRGRRGRCPSSPPTSAWQGATTGRAQPPVTTQSPASSVMASSRSLNVAADTLSATPTWSRRFHVTVNVPPVASTVIVWTSAVVETIRFGDARPYGLHMARGRSSPSACREPWNSDTYTRALAANCTPVVTADAMAATATAKFWAYTVRCRPPRRQHDGGAPVAFGANVRPRPAGETWRWVPVGTRSTSQNCPRSWRWSPTTGSSQCGRVVRWESC